jgi:pimeloyl-ACP methyl ester carboxylesterase
MPVLYQLAAALVLNADSIAVLKVPVAPEESIAVAASGAGPAVVLIPGLFGSAFGFRRVSALLVEAGYQALVVEPLGIGWSSRPAHADYSLGAQAHRIAAVLDSLGVSNAVVVAHSMGAGIAFRLAYQRSDLVAAAISLDGGPWEAAMSPGLKRALQWAPLMRLFGGTGLVRKKIREGLVQDSYDPAWVTGSVIEGYTAGAARDLGATLRAFQGMAHSREAEPLASHLAEIRCPVIVLTGAAERPNRLTADEGRLLAERIPTLRIDTVARSGHRVQEERPDAVLAAVVSLRVRLAASHEQP